MQVKTFKLINYVLNKMYGMFMEETEIAKCNDSNTGRWNVGIEP